MHKALALTRLERLDKCPLPTDLQDGNASAAEDKDGGVLVEGVFFEKGLLGSDASTGDCDSFLHSWPRGRDTPRGNL